MASREKHPVSGLTKAQENAKVKAALRQMWRKSSRANHIKSVRVPHPDPNSRFTYAVPCTECGRFMGQSEKTYYITASGRRRRTGVYHVDHICEKGMPSMKDIESDLGAYAEALIHTPLRVVCISCHATITSEQTAMRHAKN